MAVNKVVFNTDNGPETLIDLTNDTVTPTTLAAGTVAHDASGNVIEGTMSTETVLYIEQTLTEEQKSQARANIGAAEACGITYLESSTDNMVSIRDLSSGTYIFYGKFKPFASSTATVSFSSSLLVNVITGTSNTQIMVFYPVNNCIQYMKITDDAYERKNIYLNDLATLSALEDILPAVTTDDTGKFLRVSSAGVWAAESVANAETTSF